MLSDQNHSAIISHNLLERGNKKWCGHSIQPVHLNSSFYIVLLFPLNVSYCFTSMIYVYIRTYMLWCCFVGYSGDRHKGLPICWNRRLKRGICRSSLASAHTWKPMLQAKACWIWNMIDCLHHNHLSCETFL